jgi:sugar lactone lactonase YvrE
MDINGWYKNIIQNNTRALALDFDMKEGRVYWTQVGNQPQILRSFLNGTQLEVIVREGIVSPEGIAVDWIGRNLYFSDQVHDKIFVSTLTGQYMKTIVTENLNEPRALVVVPEEG